MYRNKSRVIVIIAIVLVVLLAIGATFAVLYLTTDMFKSNKTLFYKYMGQNGKIGQVLDYSELDTYRQRSESLPHTFDGQVTYTQGSSENTQATENNLINNLKIEIKGKSNPKNQDKSLDLKLRYEDTDIFHVSTIKNNELYGILSEEIITKYIAVQNNNLNEFVSKLGFEATDIFPNKIEINEYDRLFKLTDEQKANILNVYQPIFMDNIPNENYTKQKEVPLLLNNNNITTTTYSVTLTEQELYVIYQNILETSKNSQVITDLIKEKAAILGYDNSQLNELVVNYQKAIQELIDNINIGEKTSREAVKIILYTADKQLLKTDIIIYENTIIEVICDQSDTQAELDINVNQKNASNQAFVKIIKSFTNEKLEFGVTVNVIEDNDQYKAVLKIEKNGSSDASEIKNAISFGINDGNTTYRLDFTTTEDYSNSVDVEKLDTSNSVTLNNYQAEDIQNLMEAIITRLGQVFQEKITLLQSEGVVIPGLEQTNTISTQELTAFNSQFMTYSGSDVIGENVKTLLSEIINSNTLYENNKIAINYEQYQDVTDNETINTIGSLINSTSRYNITLEYGLEGFVNKIIIKVNT